MLSRLWLELELRRWRTAGQKAQLWWRDDDARACSAALQRLLSLAARHSVPIALAVIPDRPLEPIGEASRGEASLLQHGFDHQNRSPGGSACEFAQDATVDQIARAAALGWARLAHLPGARRIFVPPWNTIHRNLLAALAREGYEAISAFGGLAGGGDLPRVDAHLDILRWRRGGEFRGRGRIYRRFAGLLAQRRRAGQWQAPVGLLTHHLAHDKAAWRFLEDFIVEMQREEAVVWRSIGELIA